jgi:hypothetical protein
LLLLVEVFLSLSLSSPSSPTAVVSIATSQAPPPPPPFECMHALALRPLPASQLVKSLTGRGRQDLGAGLLPVVVLGAGDALEGVVQGVGVVGHLCVCVCVCVCVRECVCVSVGGGRGCW